MGFFSRIFGRKSEGGEGTSPVSPEIQQTTPLAPTSPAPGSAEAQQATVDKLSENLANLQQAQAVFKEPGQSTSLDNAQADVIAKKIEASGATPTVTPSVKQAEFAPTPPPQALNRVAQGQTAEVKPTATMTNEQLAAEVNKIPTPIDAVRETVPTSVPHTATPAIGIDSPRPAPAGETKPLTTPSVEKKTA